MFCLEQFWWEQHIQEKKKFCVIFLKSCCTSINICCRLVVVCTTVSQLLRQILLRPQGQSEVLREITLQQKQHFTQQAQNFFKRSGKKKKTKGKMFSVKKATNNIYYHALCTSHMILSCILWQNLVKNKRFLV